VTRGQMAAFLKRALTSATANAGSLLLARSDGATPALLRQVAPAVDRGELPLEFWCSLS
jgi:hypothetical protein